MILRSGRGCHTRGGGPFAVDLAVRTGNNGGNSTARGHSLLKPRRRDGTYIKDLPAFTKLMPWLMPTKAGSLIFFQADYDVTETLAYVKEWNRAHARGEGALLTLFEVVLLASARAVAMRPRVNRFIAGKRYYQRNQVLLTFVAKKELTDDGQETNIKVPFALDETLATTARKIRDYVRKGISEVGNDNEKIVEAAVRFPHFVLSFINWAWNWLDAHNFLPYSLTESDPMWSSIFLANVGSFGLDAPFHHLFERGNCPIFMAVGKVREENRIAKDGEGRPIVDTRKILRVNYSFDDRIADGIYMGHCLELVRRFVEDPALLESPEVLAPETVAELALRD